MHHPSKVAAKGACLACRARKVRCIPAIPRCFRCAELKIKECVYVSAKKRGQGSTLGVGEACQACRKRKRRCDAKRPCTSCSKDGRSDCQYEERRVVQCVHGKPPATAPSLLLGDPNPAEIPKVISTHSLAKLNLIPSASDHTRVMACEPHALQVFKVDRVVRGRSLGHAVRHIFPDSNPSISIVSSFLPPPIPPEPRIPLSFLGEENLRVQFSETDATDLDMRHRLWTFSRLIKLGVLFSRKRSDALLRGDQSGTVLNRAFVHGAQMLGMSLSSDIGHTPAMVRLFARRSQVASESVVEAFKGNDSRSCILCIQKSCDFIKAGSLRFVPAYGRPPEFSEDLHEILVALSQTIYWANYMFLMRGGPEPRATTELEKEFRSELPQAYPFLFEICPLTMRTQGILLVRDAIFLLNAPPTHGEFPVGSWRRLYDQALASLEEFSQNLLSNIKRFHERGNKDGADVISSSCIACLAHLAALYEFVCRTDPVAREMCNLCDLALQRLGILTSELRFEEYTYLDLLLGDSWKKSLPVFDVRIASLPLEESESLRDLRKVVEGKYSDFQARLPDCEPPLLYSLSLSEDGTTEDSNYPNLSSLKVKMQYGIL